MQRPDSNMLHQGCHTCANCPSEEGNIACMCDYGAFSPDKPDKSQPMYMCFWQHVPST